MIDCQTISVAYSFDQALEQIGTSDPAKCLFLSMDDEEFDWPTFVRPNDPKSAVKLCETLWQCIFENQTINLILSLEISKEIGVENHEWKSLRHDRMFTILEKLLEQTVCGVQLRFVYSLAEILFVKDRTVKATIDHLSNPGFGLDLAPLNKCLGQLQRPTSQKFYSTACTLMELLRPLHHSNSLSSTEQLSLKLAMLSLLYSIRSKLNSENLRDTYLLSWRGFEFIVLSLYAHCGEVIFDHRYSRLVLYSGGDLRLKDLIDELPRSRVDLAPESILTLIQDHPESALTRFRNRSIIGHGTLIAPSNDISLLRRAVDRAARDQLGELQPSTCSAIFKSLNPRLLFSDILFQHNGV